VEALHQPLWLIVARDEGGVIGQRNDLPWRLPEDLKWFKQKTMGHSLVMGRRCWDSIGRPLPGRPTVVVSRDAAFAPEGARVARNLPDAIALARCLGEQPPFICGGGEIYRQALPLVTRLYLSEVAGRHDGDITFPVLDEADWIEEGRWHASTPGLVWRVLARRSLT
jgi:dihydrofolate reductase